MAQSARKLTVVGADVTTLIAGNRQRGPRFGGHGHRYEPRYTPRPPAGTLIRYMSPAEARFRQGTGSRLELGEIITATVGVAEARVWP